MASGTTDYSKLPSQKIYEEFNKRTCSQTEQNGGQYCSARRVEAVKGGLEIWDGTLEQESVDLASRIVENHHYACKKEGGDPPYYDRCGFLYFWIGNRIKEKVSNDTKFESAMNATYNHLGSSTYGYSCQNNCRKLYDNIDKGMFEHAKKLHDWYYDYKKLGSIDTTQCKKYCANNNCTTAYSEANKAYSNLTTRCKTLSGFSYCDALEGTNGREKKEEFNQPQELPCAKVLESKPIVSETEVVEDKLGELPSRMLYQKFRGGGLKGNCSSASIVSVKSQVEQVLREGGFDENDAEKIVHGWCLIHKGIGVGDAYYDGRYHFFYSWVGNLLSEHKKVGGSFSTVMRLIHGVLQGMFTGDECKLMCDEIYLPEKKELLNNMGIVYDYITDSSTLRAQVEGDEKTCDETYRSHLDAIINACGAISTHCEVKSNASGPYCGWFNGQSRKSYCEKQTLEKLKCKQVKWIESPVSSGPGSTGTSKPGSVSASVTVSEDGNAGSIAPGAVGGGLVSVALPTIGFLLYKYTDVFDGIKKSLFGGSNNTGGRSRGRGRRSTIGHQHFDDTFTENDFSTLGGGGGGSSTLGGSSTDVSTIYNDDDGGRRRPSPPRGRAGTNNRRSGNIRYYAT
eukprot:XP_002260172.1 KIR protein [Plasmodium knowlesi strain H]